AQRKVKKITVDPQEGYQAIPIMWPHLPENEEDIKKLVRTVNTVPKVLGSLISLDRKAALIVAGFFEEKMDTKDVYQRLNALIESESDENTSVHAIGRPVLLGYILSKYSQLIYLFIGTIAAIILVLFVYFRDFRGVFVPVATALVSAVWGVGMLGFMGYNFDPLIIVAPFVISARALSHSVQLIERFLEEYAAHKDRKKAAVNTFTGLFEPGIVSIVTDAAGVFVVILTPIPLMEKLAVMGGFWVMSIIVSDMILNPIILSLLPAPVIAGEKKEDFMDRSLNRLALWSTGKGKWAIIGVSLVIFIVGYIFASRLVVGDMHPGTPMLWPGSKYNLDTARIGEKFSNTEVMSVVVEGNDRNAIKHPDVLNEMANLQRDLE
ncbi:MAG: MMPL family transporter, partial [Deltaproteobacteria bacterium]|nr:MMPL family transporter [Deltaproteobacteria bacterium]